MKAALLLALSSLPRSPAFLQGLFLPSRTTTCCWSPLALHTRRAASRSVPIAMDGTDREGYREGYRGTPTTLDSSQWREGNKAGFSVVADFGTADDVVVPPGASEQGKVRLPLLHDIGCRIYMSDSIDSRRAISDCVCAHAKHASHLNFP